MGKRPRLGMTGHERGGRQGYAGVGLVSWNFFGVKSVKKNEINGLGESESEKFTAGTRSHREEGFRAALLRLINVYLSFHRFWSLLDDGRTSTGQLRSSYSGGEGKSVRSLNPRSSIHSRAQGVPGYAEIKAEIGRRASQDNGHDLDICPLSLARRRAGGAMGGIFDDSFYCVFRSGWEKPKS
jgi:hypothetical protein